MRNHRKGSHTLFDLKFHSIDNKIAPTVTSHRHAVIIDTEGFIYVYLSNEGNVDVNVMFDDMKVTLIESPIVQADDYYPFGLTFNSYRRENSIVNKWKFQGQEHIGDLGLTGTLSNGGITSRT